MPLNFSNEMLKNAVTKADLYEINTLPNDEEIDHEFSYKFKKKMNVLIRHSKKTTDKRTLRMKNLAILITLIIVLLASSLSVSAVRSSVIEFITEIYEKYTQIIFSHSQPDEEDFKSYIPNYIPDGFTLIDMDFNEIVLLEYKKDNDFILYEQKKLVDVSALLNTESIVLEEYDFNGLPARYYSNQGVQNLIWYDEHYMYTLTSTLDKNSIFQIAESVISSEE